MGLFDAFRKRPRRLEAPMAPPSLVDLPELPSELSLQRSIPQLLEAEAVREERHILGERERLQLDKPIFVDMDMFKAMLDELTLSKKNIREMDGSLGRIQEFQADKDKEFDKWRKGLEDIQRKLMYADKALFGR